MGEYAPHIKHLSKLYFTVVTDEDVEAVMDVTVEDIASPQKAEEVRKVVEEAYDLELRPATPAEIERYINDERQPVTLWEA